MSEYIINDFESQNDSSNNSETSPPLGYDSLDNLELTYLSSIATHDYTKEYSAPPAILFVGEDIWGTANNFSIISGKAKSKKTFLLSAVIPALLTKQKILNQLHGSLKFPKNKILYVDTEQAPYHLQQVIERSLKLGSVEKQNALQSLKVLSLRALNVESRKGIIGHHLGIDSSYGILIVDGIRDLLYNINDVKEASDLINLLMSWSEEMEMHIIGVLHENKTDENVRGHLGTEAINKCETQISIKEANNGVSLVTFPTSRNLPPNPFAFRINSAGLPEACEIPSNNKSADRGKTFTDEIDDYKSVISNAFINAIEIDKETLRKAFKVSFGGGINKADERIQYCLNELNLLTKTNGKSNKAFYRKNFNNSS